MNRGDTQFEEKDSGLAAESFLHTQPQINEKGDDKNERLCNGCCICCDCWSYDRKLHKKKIAELKKCT